MPREHQPTWCVLLQCIYVNLIYNGMPVTAKYTVSFVLFENFNLKKVRF